MRFQCCCQLFRTVHVQVQSVTLVHSSQNTAILSEDFSNIQIGAFCWVLIGQVLKVLVFTFHSIFSYQSKLSIFNLQLTCLILYFIEGKVKTTLRKEEASTKVFFEDASVHGDGIMPTKTK